MEDIIQNKVAESGLVSIDLETYYPEGETAIFDIKAYLFRGLILKEKEFRAALTQTDWTIYTNKNVAVTCSADAIVPMWAYMLVTVYLQPVASAVVFGDEKTLVTTLYLRNLTQLQGEHFTDNRVVIKGCGDKETPEAVYVEITNKLRPFVKSIMYGEPCSTVPVYKRKSQ